MKLRAEGFSTNGTGDLRGTLIAVTDDGEPLGFEHRGNFSIIAERNKVIAALVDQVGAPEDVVRSLMERVLITIRQSADSAPKDGKQSSGHTLPVIVTNERYLRDLADMSWHILQEANISEPQFFQYGNTVCDLIHGAAVTRVLTLNSLRHRLDRMADFITIGNGEERPSRPPRDMLEDMLAQSQPPVLPLQGIVRGPVCRQDGSIAATEGYDTQTRLYLALGDIVIPPVADNPLDSDIHKARDLILEDLLGDFPFASAADRANAVGEVVTLSARPMIDGPTPLFDNESPTPGSGKDLLADVVSIIHTGGPAPAMTEGRDDDEWRKRLTAKLITSPSMILIDNFKRRLDSGALSAALERPIWEDRYLGVSKMVSVPISCTWICTANNPAFSDEIARRLVRIRIDARMETPWERSNFRHPDLKQWAKEHRGELLWAILTLIRAWIVRGRPKPDVVMGSFESWADTIGGILKVAGIPGFLENRNEVYAQVRAEGEGLRAFLAAWRDAYQSTRVGSDQLFELAREQKLLTDLRAGRTDHGARVALGMMLSANRGRMVGDYCINQVGVGHGGGMEYQLEIAEKLTTMESGSEKDSPVSPDSPTSKSESGDTGESGDTIPDPDSEAQHFPNYPHRGLL